MTNFDRRTFLRTISVSSSAIVLSPLFTACGGDSGSASAAAASSAETAGSESPHDPLAIPRTKPANWDPVAFNRARGHAGAIPQSYWAAIDAPDGATQAVGKHLPYVPDLAGVHVPAGMIGLMWGDPSHGNARHPSSPRSEANPQGHWFDWIEIRKATDGEALTHRSEYPDWPGDASSHFAVLGGGDILGDSGKNTIYLAAIPSDVRPGDLVRIHAHCITHGEYVDFLVVPG